MLAILGGLGAALCWATSSLASARSSRLIGAWATLGWVMLIGTLITVPAILLIGTDVDLTPDALLLLVISGAGNIIGLLLAYTAFQRGQVAIVAPILSTEGAIAAVIAVLFGEQIGIAAAVVLTAVAAGVVLASSGGRASRRPRSPAASRIPDARGRDGGARPARARPGPPCRSPSAPSSASGSASTPAPGSARRCRSSGPSCRPASAGSCSSPCRCS